MFEITLAKESFKFSAAHFTVFSAVSGERLHGHNYYVTVRLQFSNCDAKTALAYDFAPLKSEIQTLCDEWDEYVLLALESPWISVKETAGTVEMSFGEKKYSFPSSDTQLLPISNVTCESLAKLFTEKLASSFGTIENLERLTVNVEETRGQSVSYSLATQTQELS